MSLLLWFFQYHKHGSTLYLKAHFLLHHFHQHLSLILHIQVENLNCNTSWDLSKVNLIPRPLLLLELLNLFSRRHLPSDQLMLQPFSLHVISHNNHGVWRRLFPWGLPRIHCYLYYVRTKVNAFDYSKEYEYQRLHATNDRSWRIKKLQTREQYHHDKLSFLEAQDWYLKHRKLPVTSSHPKFLRLCQI